MANGNLGSYAVTLPNMFQAPGQALQSATQQLERQTEAMADRAMREQEMAQRKAERDEAQMYRKMQTIQELSDLSKYQTANDVANAIGNKSANEIKNKYIQLAREGKVGLADIMEGVNKEIAATTEGMNALKIEHESFDKAAQELKKQFPNIDTTSLYKDYRQDVINRRLKNGISFTNPIEVQESSLVTNLANPDYLSRYIRGGKSLTEAITAPKGLEKSSVFTGSPMENVKFEAQIPFWMKPSFTPDQAPGGFLPKGTVPKLQIKSTILPPEAIPSSSKQPFQIVEEEVFNRFTQEPNTNLELIQATREKYPQYDTFKPIEKEYAKRNVLYDKLSTLDQSQFYPTASTRAPITNINIPKEPVATINVYPEVEKLVDTRQSGKAAPLNQLSANTQGIVLDFARKAKGDNQLSQNEVAIKRNEKGEISLYEFDISTGKLGTMIAPIPKLDVNLEAQPTAAGKAQVVKASAPSAKKYTYQGKTYTEAQLMTAAKQSGMTLEEYKKALKL